MAVRRTSRGEGRRPENRACAVNELLMKLPPHGVVAWTMFDTTFLIIIIILSTIAITVSLFPQPCRSATQFRASTVSCEETAWWALASGTLAGRRPAGQRTQQGHRHRRHANCLRRLLCSAIVLVCLHASGVRFGQKVQRLLHSRAVCCGQELASCA